MALASMSAQARDTQRVIVQFKAGKDEAKVKEKVKKHGGRVKKYIHLLAAKILSGDCEVEAQSSRRSRRFRAP